MKKVINTMLIFVLTAGILSPAEAQRGGNRSSGDRHGGGASASPQRNTRSESFRPQNNGNRTNSAGNIDRSATFRRNDGRANAMNNSRIISTNQQRSSVFTGADRGRRYSSGPAQNAYRGNSIISVRNVNRNGYTHYNNYGNRNYSNRNYSYGNNYYSRGGYRPRFFSYGPRYSILPRSFITINFGGYPYYYNNGLFYGSSGGYYQSLFPPPGLSIGVLPFGYSRIFIGANLFYYYNGIYYRQYNNEDKYEVVDAPLGATVSSLPRGAEAVVLNGEKLYEFNGTYYKKDRDNKGATVYTVEGKNGEVNNSDDVAQNSDNYVPPSSLNNGDIINQLPEGSKRVTINGEMLYLTPDDTYLKEESDGNMIQYKVVGK